jgi:hypothetical protein
MEGFILITSLNRIIDRILESISNILKYVNNETELSVAVSMDAGHLSLGIVPLSWDQSASNIFVQYTEYLSMLQSQKKNFDFVCMQIENISEMAEEEDQRLTILSAGVAVRSFASYIVPKFATHLASSNQDMLSLLGKTTQLNSMQQWMLDNSDRTELLFWTANHRFGNQLRREALSPSALHFQSIKEFVRDCMSANVDWRCTNQGATYMCTALDDVVLTFVCSDPSAITAFFSMMITKPLSQFFVYDKATCKSRPCGQNLPTTSGSFSHLSEVTHIFQPISEVRPRCCVEQALGQS